MTADNRSPAKYRGEIGRRDLFRLLLPRDGAVFSWSLELDSEKCSVCGLCAAGCPTGAMAADGDEHIKIVFRHDLCDACGRCLGVCPERCLRLERTLAANSRELAPVVMIESGVARCSECGRPVGPQTMVDRVQSRLEAVGRHALLPLCPACKLRCDLAR